LEKAKQMGINGRSAAEKVFSWDKVAEQTLNVYRELVG